MMFLSKSQSPIYFLHGGHDLSAVPEDNSLNI